MSRIGKLPIQLPAGVEVKIEGKVVSVKGPKWELKFSLPEGVEVKMQDNTLKVSIKDEMYKPLWGTVRSVLANMVEGVHKGWSKKLLVVGVGYGVQVQGNKLVLKLGYSHPIEYQLPEGITAKVEKAPNGDMLILEGIDKQLVGQTAAVIRDFRRPDPYKGKWVRYADEVLTLKPGKAAKK